MAKTDIHSPQKQDPTEVWGTGQGQDDLATIVGQVLPSVMRDPSSMNQLQVAIDSFLKKNISEDPAKRVAQKRDILDMLKRGSGALEFIAARVGFSIG